MDALVENDAAFQSEAIQKPRSLRRRLYSNAAWSIGGRLLSMGSVFATNVLLARNLSTAEFSAYAIAAATAIFLAMPASLGAPRVVLRLIREAHAAGQSAMAVHSVWACLRLVLATCAIVSIVFILGVETLGDAAKWQAVRDYSLLVAAWFALSAVCLTVSHALQGFDDFRSAALTGAKNGGILSNVLSVTAIGVALQTDHLTLRFALAAQVIAHIVALLYASAAFWLIIRKVPKAIPQTALNGSDRRSMLWFFSESWPILVIQLTSLGVASLDILLVSWLTTDREIAAYAAVIRLCELLGATQVLAVAIATPFISELYAAKQLKKLEEMLRGIASLTAMPTLIVATVMLMAPRATLEFTYGPDFASGAAALRIGVIGCSIAVLSGTNSLVMIMTGQQRQLLKMSAATGALYLLVAPMLISAWGITGAAAASSIIFGAYNIVITLTIKSRLGIWTTAAISPAAYVHALRHVICK